MTACRHTHLEPGTKMWLLIDEQSQEPHYKLLSLSDRPMRSFPQQVLVLRSQRSPRSPHRQHTNKRRRPARDKWPFHNKVFIESCASETLNSFPPAQTPLSSSVRLLLGLHPIMPCAVRRHLQHLPELSLHASSNNAAQTQLRLGSLRQFKAFISCFFLLLFSLAATVNIYFQCINILMNCC